MNLSNLRKEQSLSQSRLAEMLTAAGFPATQALVSQWETGAVVLSAERAMQIQLVTAGAIRKESLRPDLPWAASERVCGEGRAPAQPGPTTPDAQIEAAA